VGEHWNSNLECLVKYILVRAMALESVAGKTLSAHVTLIAWSMQSRYYVLRWMEEKFGMKKVIQIQMLIQIQGKQSKCDSLLYEFTKHRQNITVGLCAKKST
jgi:hypothetical protein